MSSGKTLVSNPAQGVAFGQLVYRTCDKVG